MSSVQAQYLSEEQMNEIIIIWKNQQQSVELSRATILYLKKVFDQYSKGQELSFGMFSEIFSTTNSPP